MKCRLVQKEERAGVPYHNGPMQHAKWKKEESEGEWGRGREGETERHRDRQIGSLKSEQE